MPLILPEVISGALFAIITSLGEIVFMRFIAGPEQRTIPCGIWCGIREEISSAILTVATILLLIPVTLPSVVERLWGISPR